MIMKGQDIKSPALFLWRTMMHHDKPIAAGKSSFDLVDVKGLFQLLSLKEGMTVLDVACGRGPYSLIASRHIGPAGRVYAVDLWGEGIRSLREASQGKGLGNIEGIVADVSIGIPVEDASIDMGLMVCVLHDLIEDSTDQGTLKEMVRIIKPGGELAVVEFKKIEGPPGPPLAIRLSPDEVEERLKPFGFTAVSTHEVGEYNYLTIFTKM